MSAATKEAPLILNKDRVENQIRTLIRLRGAPMSREDRIREMDKAIATAHQFLKAEKDNPALGKDLFGELHDACSTTEERRANLR